MARPKRVFTGEEVQRMEECALNGCQNNTIATIIGMGVNTLKRRFGKQLTKKRAERKSKLRKQQTLLAVSNPAMAIFLGKNELGQQDKQVIETKPITKTKTQAEIDAATAAARTYKLKIAKGA